VKHPVSLVPRLNIASERFVALCGGRVHKDRKGLAIQERPVGVSSYRDHIVMAWFKQFIRALTCSIPAAVAGGPRWAVEGVVDEVSPSRTTVTV
jgi:hypothetical protein